jgi:lipopolysaccharide biosynthesis regulator YciM
VRDRARFELACDFTVAGLMDRAEQLLLELTGVAAWRERALDQLVRLYEQQGDWANALRSFNELPPRQQHERRAIAAHYLCELAEDALAQGDLQRAVLLLRQARARQADCARATVLDARVAEAEARPQAALDGYLAAAAAAPQLLLELAPRILGVEQRAGRAGALADLLGDFARAGRISDRQRVLLPLLVNEPLTQRRGADAATRYQCNVCGLGSMSWYWRCPSCRSWESLTPGLLQTREAP